MLDGWMSHPAGNTLSKYIVKILNENINSYSEQ